MQLYPPSETPDASFLDAPDRRVRIELTVHTGPDILTDLAPMRVPAVLTLVQDVRS